MIELSFDGWFQCRLATDPDPSDEPRGVSGWTFALPGEPPLDRIIRTQPISTVPRTHGPAVGVTVREVSVEGLVQPAHPLLGAEFELLSDPVFEGRNGLATEDTEEPIFPLHFRIAKAGLEIVGRHRDRLTGEWVLQRATGIAPISQRALVATRTGDPRAFWSARRAALLADFGTASSDVEREGLRWRLAPIERALQAEDDVIVGAVPMSIGLRYAFALDGPWHSTNLPGAAPSGWSLNLWTGCWDADALCGFMEGSLQLPTRSRRRDGTFRER